MVDFVELLENEERMLGGRLTDYKPASTVAIKRQKNDPKWKV
jgi:hypothetical protein